MNKKEAPLEVKTRIKNDRRQEADEKDNRAERLESGVKLVTDSSLHAGYGGEDVMWGARARKLDIIRPR